MYTAPRSCPVCSETFAITRLECRGCGTVIQGGFTSSGLTLLSGDQLSFIETFIQCEGKFNRMEKIVGLSYPTLRARLHEIIQVLGYPVSPEAPLGLTQAERGEILDRIADGRLTAQEAMVLLQANNQVGQKQDHPTSGPS